MINKLSQKDFLSLREAADFCTSELSEQYFADDILFYICEKQLDVYWHLNRVYAQEVSYQSYKIPDFADFSKEGTSLLEPKQWIWTQGFSSTNKEDPSYEPTTSLVGCFKIDLDINGQINAFLRNHLNGLNDDPCVSIDGIFLSDERGAYWQLLDTLPKFEAEFGGLKESEINELAVIKDCNKRTVYKNLLIDGYSKRISRLPPTKEGMAIGLIDDFNKRVNSLSYGDFAPAQPFEPCSYYPIDSRPSIGELMIQTSDLKGFVKSVKNSIENNPENNSKTNNCFLRTIKVLVDDVIGGSTGKHYKDAGICLKYFEEKSIDFPVKVDRLAGYLREARSLNK